MATVASNVRFKTASVLAWFFGAYFLLLFVVTSWWLVLPLTVVLGLADARWVTLMGRPVPAAG